jgi:hypothetical protein
VVGDFGDLGELGSSLILCRGVGRELKVKSKDERGVPEEWLGRSMEATEVRGIFNALVAMGAIPIEHEILGEKIGTETKE